MKSIFSFALCLLLIQVTVMAQKTYWQQKVAYDIKVSLNDVTHSLTGELSVDYTNESPDTLEFIWFHIWPNAYKNDQTAMMQQLKKIDHGKTDLNKITNGWIDGLQFNINGTGIAYEPHPTWNDVIKLPLPSPLVPGKTIQIQTPFHLQLPSYFSRSGFDKDQFMICQWYPKPAVYDRKGWHPIPYLDQGEFFSEFGSFKVSITLPASYVVGATGQLQDANERTLYKEIGKKNYTQRKTEQVEYYPKSPGGKTKTLEYKAENVHDFAWFASKDYIIQYDTLLLSNNHSIDVFTYKQPKGNPSWRGSIGFVKDAVRNYSSWIGDYPYPVVQAVEGPLNSSSGGMEYPMITLITSPDADEEGLDAVIAHEVGHNWFYGILGSNERLHPWMDEGLNTYYEMRYEAEKYRSNSIFGTSIPVDLKELSANDFLDRIYGALSKLPGMKGSIDTPADEFKDQDTYGTVVYLKTSVWFYVLHQAIAKDLGDRGIQTYFNEWKFKHPYPEDLKQSLENASGMKLDTFFELLKREESF